MFINEVKYSSFIADQLLGKNKKGYIGLQVDIGTIGYFRDLKVSPRAFGEDQEKDEKIDIHFVQNEIDPTGMGEPPFPPVFAAVANALYRATGKRYYHQPFLKSTQLKKGITNKAIDHRFFSGRSIKETEEQILLCSGRS